MIEKSGHIPSHRFTGKPAKSIREEAQKPPGDSFVKSDPGEKPEKEWTVLAYMSGSNELREFMTSNLKEMESVGSTDQMDVAVYLSRDNRAWSLRNLDCKVGELIKRRPSRIDNPWKGSRVYHVKQGDPESRKIESELVEDRGREKVRDPKTLQRFLEWGMQKYPAKHYMVVLSSHGNGFRGVLMDRDGKLMDVPEVREAIEGAEKNTGKKVDVLAMEACQMGQMSVAYEMKDSADYFVASPGKIYDNAFDYKAILGEIDKSLKAGKKISPEQMASLLVESTEQFYEDVPTLTAFDLKQMTSIKSSLDKFTKALENTKTSESVIERIIYDSPSHDSSVYSKKQKPQREYVDIIGFCNRIIKSDEVKDLSLKSKASNLKKAIDSATIHKKVHYSQADDQGLSLHIPKSRGAGHSIDPKYQDMKLSKESKWDEHISGGSKGLLKAITGFLGRKLGI
ncbi:MAG: hypothetical protein K8T10_09420 [Candidatus Eremiobacteraeota bacterium]|nr:hypothetical protein [Candidatus Eremiobacteraeota bacterium]